MNAYGRLFWRMLLMRKGTCERPSGLYNSPEGRFMVVCLMGFVTLSVYAQEERIPEQVSPAAAEADTLPELEDPLLGLPEAELPPVPPKEKIPSPRLFYGVKAKRFRQRSRQKDLRLVEILHVLPKEAPEETPPYVPYVYWYDRADRQIRFTARNAPRQGPLLHGRYLKKWKKLILEERFFYHGTAHGRWTFLSTSDVLLDKRHYYHGWTANGKQSYYDLAQTKLKEAIPIQHDRKDGLYFAFHPNGQMAVQGIYRDDQRVRLWREYYASGTPKRELQYRNNPYEEHAPAFILREWSPSGELIYEAPRRKRR